MISEPVGESWVALWREQFKSVPEFRIYSIRCPWRFTFHNFFFAVRVGSYSIFTIFSASSKLIIIIIIIIIINIIIIIRGWTLINFSSIRDGRWFGAS